MNQCAMYDKESLTCGLLACQTSRNMKLSLIKIYCKPECPDSTTGLSLTGVCCYPGMSLLKLAWHIRVGGCSAFTCTPLVPVQEHGIKQSSLHASPVLFLSVLNSHIPLMCYVKVILAVLMNKIQNFRISHNRDLFITKKNRQLFLACWQFCSIW